MTLATSSRPPRWRRLLPARAAGAAGTPTGRKDSVHSSAAGLLARPDRPQVEGDRLLFRPGTAQVRTLRAGVVQRCRPPMPVIGCGCCCHRCCQPQPWERRADPRI